MGQSSLPISNKLGVSMRWDSCYDNLINFKKQLLLDIFLKKFFDFVFEDKLIFFFFNNFFKKNLKFNFFLNIFKFKNKKIVTYLSKLWILKYQRWFIVSFYLYVPKVFLKKNLNFKKIKINNNFSLLKFNFFQNKKNDLLYKYFI